jgi:WD40 repeat protein
MIRCIAWLDDDSGFVSSGWDASIYVWQLKNNGGDDNRYVWEYNQKGVNFTCLTTYKQDAASKHTIYATDTLRCLRELEQGDKEKITRFEQQTCLQQVVLMHGRRAIFGGVGGGTQEQNKPGSIQVLSRFPFEKTFEIQAHSLPVEQMRVSYDNTTLFSCSQDGSICVFSIQDRDNKKKDKELPTIQYSQVILI